jgi:hypothetical protein
MFGVQGLVSRVVVKVVSMEVQVVFETIPKLNNGAIHREPEFYT